MKRSLHLAILLILVAAGSFAQAPKIEKPVQVAPGGAEKIRDVPFPGGVDLQYLIQELARDIDLNVLFDPESRLGRRKVQINIRNVTTFQALQAILRQENLVYENAGPRTILVSNGARLTSVPQLGVGLIPLSDQLSQYFGVTHGVLVSDVGPGSPAAAAGLQAGDVIVEFDGTPVTGALGIYRVVEKPRTEVPLKIVRKGKQKTLAVAPLAGLTVADPLKL